jgi:hypothetical protein
MKNKILLISAFILLKQFAFAQCYPNRHSTNFFDGWLSCEPAMSPNPDRPESHFILYDFQKVFALGQMTIWNTNDPSHLDCGMRDVAIDYSTDGITWQNAGEYTFPQASGLSTYEGAAGPNLNDIEARYLLITALTNYGGACYGISEMNVVGEEVIISAVEDPATLACVDISLYPNPFADQVTLGLSSECTGQMNIMIYDGAGKMLSVQSVQLIAGQENRIELGQDLPSGAYALFIEFGGKTVRRNIVKMNRS